ncbi:hypothetical protein [Pelagicoccus sp. SDUM812003]|uniref:hypothetical protein n=1 Tax=Pelagicoccus sp. SDUM812003 TaxID=3041267 RepID=UPI00280E94F1|nr:hypothetical protein [Pelagicoccus sp. SDUM812003]MDQ8203024.1 hypothetical protein [Pelagicoccus sp. SDUM812003]
MKNAYALAVATIAAAASNALAGDFTYSGFISNGYLHSDENNYFVDSEDGSFEFVEAAVNATWTPIERTSVKGQLFAFELGEYGNYEPLIDYLFVDYNVNPALGLRVGRVKRSVGLYTDIQDIDIARTSVLLPVGMYDSRYRDFSASVDGVSLYGSLSTGALSSVDYIAYHGAMDFGTEGGFAGAALTSLSRELNNTRLSEAEVDTNSGLQLWWNTPLSGLRLGANHNVYSGLAFKADALIPVVNYPITIETQADISETRLSAEYYVGDWTLTTEYHIQDVEAESLRSIAGNPLPAELSESKANSWYVSGARRFLEKFEGAVTYAAYYDNTDQKDDPLKYQKDIQFSLRYDATDYWTLKAEVHFMDGMSRLFNQLGQNPNPVDDWTLFAAKSTFTF